MDINVFDVFFVEFRQNLGGELNGNHYAVVLTEVSRVDNTLLVAPITSKKPGKRYRGGITIDCTKYQKNPSYQKAFIRLNKIREVDKRRIKGELIYSLDSMDIIKLKEALKTIFQIE